MPVIRSFKVPQYSNWPSANSKPPRQLWPLRGLIQHQHKSASRCSTAWTCIAVATGFRRGLLVVVSGYRGQVCLLDFKFTYSRVVEILGTECVLPQSVYPVVRHLQLCTMPTRSMGQDTNQVQGTAELKAITTNKLGIFQPKR